MAIWARFRIPPNCENDFFVDRSLQRANRGVNGYAASVARPYRTRPSRGAWGPIYDRSSERLGTSDTTAIAVRRPRPTPCDRAGIFLPKGAAWFDAAVDLSKALVDHADIDMAVNGYEGLRR